MRNLVALVVVAACSKAPVLEPADFGNVPGLPVPYQELVPEMSFADAQRIVPQLDAARRDTNIKHLGGTVMIMHDQKSLTDLRVVGDANMRDVLTRAWGRGEAVGTTMLWVDARRRVAALEQDGNCALVRFVPFAEQLVNGHPGSLAVEPRSLLGATCKELRATGLLTGDSTDRDCFVRLPHDERSLRGGAQSTLHLRRGADNLTAGDRVWAIEWNSLAGPRATKDKVDDLAKVLEKAWGAATTVSFSRHLGPSRVWFDRERGRRADLSEQGHLTILPFRPLTGTLADAETLLGRTKTEVREGRTTTVVDAPGFSHIVTVFAPVDEYELVARQWSVEIRDDRAVRIETNVWYADDAHLRERAGAICKIYDRTCDLAGPLVLREKPRITLSLPYYTSGSSGFMKLELATN